jgi:glutaredoxin
VLVERSGGEVVVTLTVYTKNGCSTCGAVIRDLDRQGVPYRLIDVGRDAEGAKELSQLSGGRGVVPTVVDERGEVLMGFGCT